MVRDHINSGNGEKGTTARAYESGIALLPRAADEDISSQECNRIAALAFSPAMDRTGEIEKPQIVVVIRELPSGNARKEGVHNDELLDFCGELCGIRVRTISPMSWPTTRAFVMPRDFARV